MSGVRADSSGIRVQNIVGPCARPVLAKVASKAEGGVFIEARVFETKAHVF